jgi:hypothetical protein
VGEPDAYVAVAGQVGKGRLFAMSDPSAFINSMLRYPGNRAFAAGLIRYLANDAERGQGRLYVITNQFQEEGSVGGDRSLGKDVESFLRSLGESLSDARRNGLPGWVLAVLAALIVTAAGIWVARASGRPYKSPIPRYARPTPLVARGGVAGRFAMLAAPSSPRSLVLLELRSAMVEAISERFALGDAPSTDAVMRAVRGSGLVDAAMAARLSDVVRQMQRAEAAMLAGSSSRISRDAIDNAHAVVAEVLAACRALERRVESPQLPVEPSPAKASSTATATPAPP